MDDRDTLPRDIDTRLRWALEIALQAGAATLHWFRRAHQAIETKADGTPVTEADRAAETRLREAISQRFPDDSIVGEEYGEKRGSSPYQWVLDPIDGTKAFITGVPLYTTLVGVLKDDQPVLGVIHAPATAETIYAGVGGRCWYLEDKMQPVLAQVSRTPRFSDATMLTSSVRSFVSERDPGSRETHRRLEDACRLARTWGDAYGYLLVAAGRADVMVDPALNLWDAVALKPIIEAAGGRFTDWQGRPTVHSADGVATNGLLHEEVLKILQG